MFLEHVGPYLFALRVVWQSSKKWTIARFILIALQSTLPLALLYLMKLIIDSITNSGLESGELFSVILNYLIIFGILLLIQTATNTLSQFVSEAQEQRVSDYMAEIVQNQALKLDLSYFDNPKFHNSYFQAQREAVFRPMSIVTSLMMAMQNGISLLLLSGFLSFMHIGVAFVLILSIIPSIIIRFYYSRKTYQWTKQRVAKERESHYINMLMGDAQYAKEIRVFNAGDSLRKRFNEIRQKLFLEKLAIGKLRTRNTLLAKVFEILSEVGVYIFIVYRTVNGIITIGDMVIYFQAFQKGKTNLTGTLEAIVRLFEHRMFLTYINDFLGFKSKLKEVPNISELPKHEEKILEFRNVAFRYPEQPGFAIEDVSLTFKKGSFYAIVGENGSGKSTLVKLLCRLYDPEHGEINYRGVPLSNYPLTEYQRNLSVTFQDFARYQFSVKENVTFGSSTESETIEIEEALSISGASEFVKTMPKGYEQKLGKQFNEGVELSLGQWQKIAISRAIYRNAEIVLLDEPTSAIDPLAEHQIFHHLKEMAKDKIVILVTHRLYNLKLADEIIVMDNGHVLEVGSHTELIKGNGKYMKMFEKQLHD